MRLKIKSPAGKIKPLERVAVTCGGPGTLAVRDGRGREYIRQSAGDETAFTVAGALGVHLISLEDSDGKILDTLPFSVDCETSVDDGGGEWRRFFELLRWNLFKGREAKIVRYENRPYFIFSDWLRDHVHILKGKRYFAGRLKDAIELFGRNQQDNGMFFDFYMPHEPESTTADDRFIQPDCVKTMEHRRWVFQRVPVENDVEYLFTEGLYRTWQAEGDDEWMRRWLPAAEKGLRYSMTDMLRWSKKYGLLKRGFTIDTWDYQSEEDSAVTGDTMDIHPFKTRFGVMHGDNTGFAAACRYLAAMLEHTGDKDKAEEWRRTADEILNRLNKVSWNGAFFRHHVPEDENTRRDLDVDQEKQVSLSNTYALDRGIPHEQGAAILKTYQRIRREMPESSPGEFYGIYPPFGKGFGGHQQVWHYVNGGVFPFIGGELAHGAFQHGFEDYGADILQRLNRLLESHEGEFPYFWLGAIGEPGRRDFKVLPLREQANTDFSGKGAPGVPGWTGQGEENDLSVLPPGSHQFHEIPFDVLDPGKNGRRACIGLSRKKGYATEITLSAGHKAASIYLHHTMAGSGMAGWVTLQYTDGASRREYVVSGRHVRNWWGPTDIPYNRREGWRCRAAWRGRNQRTTVGTFVWGFDNPHPEKTIGKITFTHALNDNFWFILGVTLGGQPVYFKPQDACFGWLENWNAAAVLYALLEGLAGVKDAGAGFRKAVISPRWTAAGAERMAVTVKYEASGSYVSYQYAAGDRQMTLSAASSGEKMDIELLLPPEKKVRSAAVNGQPSPFEIKTAESSSYLCLKTPGPGAHRVEAVFQ